MVCCEIATSLDKIGMILRRAQDERKILAMAAGRFSLTKWLRVRGEGACGGVIECAGLTGICHPTKLPGVHKGAREFSDRWFDRLTMSEVVVSPTRSS